MVKYTKKSTVDKRINKPLTKLEQFHRAAEIIAEEPLITKRKVMSRLGYSETSSRFHSTYIDWIKSDEFKALLELKKIASVFSDIGEDLALYQQRPIYELTVKELLDRLIDPRRREEIPTRVLMEFALRYAKAEAELKGQMPPEVKISLKAVQNEMEARVSPEVKKTLEAEIKKN